MSTYQDGTGQEEGGALPGWRDFERVSAVVFGGTAKENKAIFDVLIPHPTLPGQQYGISCKMRRELGKVRRKGRVSLELMNAHKQTWAALAMEGITHENYLSYAPQAGQIAIGLVERWIHAVSIPRGGSIDLSRSFYLVLSWAKGTVRQPQPTYQLHQFLPVLPDPSSLIWTFRESEAHTLVGTDSIGGVVFEWYGNSGGQFKYFPHERDAVWQSDEFHLEPLPGGEYGAINKVAAYFPKLWKEYFP
ncbi:MAG: hypothetical protein M3R24_39030 [Chloroflexota bacterium]|nr:hypothetical protein [Chloroflexota bacterium]